MMDKWGTNKKYKATFSNCLMRKHILHLVLIDNHDRLNQKNHYRNQKIRLGFNRNEGTNS